MPSRPGYPVLQMADRVYTNHYFRASDGQVFDGEVAESYKKLFADFIGPNTPGWPHVKQDNAVFHGSFSRNDEHYHLEGDHISGDRSYGDWPAEDLDNGFHPYDHDGPGDADLLQINRNQVFNRLISNIQDGKVNLAQAWAEREQVVNLVASTARRFANVVHNLRAFNVPGAARALLGSVSSTRVGKLVGGVPEQWLAFQYGWKPLMGDIYGSCNELADMVYRSQPPVMSSRASAVTVGELYSVFKPGSSFGRPGRNWVRSPVSIHGSGFLEYGLASNFGAFTSRTGILNPWELAWELLPYSFVVDWFLPVGNFLQNLQFDTGLVLRRGWFAQKLEDSWTATIASSTTNLSGWTLQFLGGTSRCKAKYYQRELITHSPVPTLPSLKNPLSLNHLANALSLLSVTFGGKSGARPIFVK